MNSLKPHIAFMSCERDSESRLETELRQTGLSFTTGTGMYQGVAEKSYLIILSTEIHIAERKLKQVVKLGERFHQDCIMYCDNERTSYLLYMNSPLAPKIGTLQAVAIPEGDYSCFNGQCYEVK